jgi:hypothetical protein
LGLWYTTLLAWSIFGKFIVGRTPTGVIEIGSGAFSCPISTVTLPKGLTVVNGFSGSKIKNITIPEGVTRIDEKAFWSCQSLESVVFPSTIKEICPDAFANCSNLTSVTFPNTVVSVAFTSGGMGSSGPLSSFDGCKKLNLVSQAAIKKLGYRGAF